MNNYRLDGMDDVFVILLFLVAGGGLVLAIHCAMRLFQMVESIVREIVRERRAMRARRWWRP